MARAAPAEGLFTFLFTDIVGSTRLWERAPKAARQALARHNELVKTIVSLNGGSVFKMVGDACCCVFGTASDAIAAAVAMQRDLATEPWPSAVGTMQIRIGIHSGDAICEDGDYFGPALNRVARLVSAAHGGQIVLSSVTADLASGSLPPSYAIADLGSHRLKDLSEAQHIFQVNAAGLPAEFPALASLDAKPNNLPSQLSSFVGRGTELTQLRELLSLHRLVTICGAGGIGKTRMALQAAADTIGSFADGSWFVRLADISDSALVAQTIAATLHVAGVPGQEFNETLADRLRDKKLFLLLDNSEHVLPGTADLVRTLLGSCPHVSMLVTSREPLHVAGEAVLRIGPLEPEDAYALFARRSNLTGVDACVRDICDKLDRLPLAIELAASRIGTLTAKQMDDRLTAILPVLASKDPSQEARHRTLQATLAWSYRLLNPKEQRFFSMLAVFEGGFTLEACEAVAWAGEEDDPAFVLLDALVDKSFVAAEPVGDAMRYRLLDFLHRYACEKLYERPSEADLAHRTHFEFFKAMAQRWGKWSSDEDECAYLSEFERELPNLRAALTWSLKQSDKAPCLELLLNVLMYWQQHANTAEARKWLNSALDQWDGSAEILYAKLFRRAATFATIEDDYDAARELTQRASELFRRLGDRSGLAEALHNLAVIEQRSGSEETALQLYSEALKIFEETGHEIGTITASYNIALVHKQRGELAQAKEYLQRGMALCTTPQHGDRLGTFRMLYGEIAMREGRFDEAAASLQEALSIKRALHDRHDEVETLCNIAVFEIRRGDWSAARRNAAEALTLAHELELPSLFIACFELCGALLLHADDPARAREVMAVAKALRGERGYVYGIMNDLRDELTGIADVEAAVLAPGRVRRLTGELAELLRVDAQTAGGNRE
ncbi:MAG TPA: tetratricopeptide repeat protein [Candidatus Baltobacteraceae bacterium]|nr:tetratricopeptide repeat protein [Candidatus Baltobacteraceae bacterium]